MLLPAKPGTCPICAVEHASEDPHNAQSIYYQYWFYKRYQRWPTWADAIAHCGEETRKAWESALRDREVWTKPEGNVEPIPNHPADHKAK